MSKRAPTYPPDYCDKDGLAHRLSMKVGLIDQLLRRGILPPPIKIGEALRWRWADVDRIIRGVDGGTESHSDNVPDPYMDGINGKTAETEH